MTWYLSGPMTGYDNLNFPAFQHAAAMLRVQGHDVFSPHENTIEGEWADYLRHDIQQLSKTEGIVLLKGWSKSSGAQLELLVALRLGFTVRYFDEVTGALIDVG